jgi:hypothetical protein
MLVGNILDRVDSINDLGVIMDSKMSFTGHIDFTVGKALSMLGFVKRLLRPFMFPLYARNLNTPVVCGGLSMVRTSIELSVCSVCIAWFGVDGHVRSSSIRGQMLVDSARDTGRKVW